MASKAQFSNNHNGLTVANEANNNVPVALGDMYRVQMIQNGQQLKLDAFNKYIIALEWPNGVREIYGNEDFVISGKAMNGKSSTIEAGIVSFRHPARKKGSFKTFKF